MLDKELGRKIIKAWEANGDIKIIPSCKFCDSEEGFRSILTGYVGEEIKAQYTGSLCKTALESAQKVFAEFEQVRDVFYDKLFK